VTFVDLVVFDAMGLVRVHIMHPMFIKLMGPLIK